jgi:phenylalanyl-tRNA synthetase beta subunit
VEAADLFRGKNVPAGKCSLLVRVVFQSHDYIDGSTINDYSARMIAALEENLGATLRTS